MDLRLTGKVLFFVGVISLILGFLWREIFMQGIHRTYIVYFMNVAGGLTVLGLLLWLSYMKKRK